jgi:hypothetical protein
MGEMKMRWFLSFAALALLAPAAANAQAADTAAIAAEQAGMAKLAWMHGVWRGPAVTQGAGGEHRVTQTERIGSFLDGTVTVIEGKAYQADGSIGFHAFGVISYDPATKTYWLTSNAQGRSGKFELKPTDSGYSWDIPMGPATIHYTATLADGIWTEVGDYVIAGQSPHRFFVMTLKRVGNTDWPEAGGVPRD